MPGQHMGIPTMEMYIVRYMTRIQSCVRLLLADLLYPLCLEVGTQQKEVLDV